MHVKFEPLLRTGQHAREGAPLLYVLNNLRAVALFRRRLAQNVSSRLHRAPLTQSAPTMEGIMPCPAQ